MVNEGIVLGHKISAAKLEVDQAKDYVIETLMPPATFKGIISFLGHVGFYRDLKKTSQKFQDHYADYWRRMPNFTLMNHAGLHLKKKKSRLVIASIMATPVWNKDFEIMCDASDYAMGAVLGQRTKKIFIAI